jgi:hypothetical protein
VTKNHDTFNGFVWICDSSVSALITHLYLDTDEYNKMNKKLIHVFTIKKDCPYLSTPLELDLWSYGNNKPKFV